MQKNSFTFDNPSPRLVYEGEEHPITGQRVLRQDAVGYRAARRAISRDMPAHSSLQSHDLWPDLRGRE